MLRSAGDSSCRCGSEHAGRKHRSARSSSESCVLPARSRRCAGTGGQRCPVRSRSPARAAAHCDSARHAPLPPTVTPPPRRPISAHRSARPRSLLAGCPLLASPIGCCPRQESRGRRPLVYHSCPARARGGMAPPLSSSRGLPLAARNAPSALRLAEGGRRYFKKGLRAPGRSRLGAGPAGTGGGFVIVPEPLTL